MATTTTPAAGTKFGKFLGGIGGFFGRRLDYFAQPEHQHGILKILQWVGNHAPEIGMFGIALCGVGAGSGFIGALARDPALWYLTYKTTSSARDMFNKADGMKYEATFFDEIMRIGQGYTEKLDDKEAASAKEKYLAGELPWYRGGGGLRRRSKSKLKDFFNTIDLKGRTV
ncbi:MAG: hypothetical protein LBI17_00590 [Rickettsiales bacterium]|nr:hypothetical protein [Rickettsiales bacterium]